MNKLTMEEIEYYANAISKSGYLKDVQTKEQAVTKILFGQELGLNIAASMKLQMFSGSVEMHYSIIASQIKASEKYDFRVIQRDDDCCIVAFYENDELKGEVVWDIDRAVKARLCNAEGKSKKWDKNKGTWVVYEGNYYKYRSTMLFARCMSEGARIYCSEVFGMPVYSENEIETSETLPDEVVYGETIDFKKPEEKNIKKIEEPKPKEVDEKIKPVAKKDFPELAPGLNAKEFNEFINKKPEKKKTKRKIKKSKFIIAAEVIEEWTKIVKPEIISLITMTCKRLIFKSLQSQ